MYAVQGTVTGIALAMGLAGCGLFDTTPFAVEQDQIW